MREERYSRSLKVQKSHFFVGLVISLVVTLLIAFNAFNFWVWQASVMDWLLSFAGVSHRLFVLGGRAEGFTTLLGPGVTMGPTFEMPVHYQPIPSSMVVIIVILLALSILIVNVFRRIPPPARSIWLVISIISISTLLWKTLVSPSASYNLHWVTIDWSCSGVITLCVITLIYVPFLFTIEGPLWVKVLWLFTAIGFSIVWNLLRLSFVTATLYYSGVLAFLLVHYLIGAFIEFVYIVALYSLGLAHLSKYDVSGAMKFGA